MTKKGMSQYSQYRYFKKIRKDGFGAFKIIPYTRKRAIGYYCRECVGFIYSEVVSCTMKECPLFPYRLGKMPDGKSAHDRSKAIKNHCLECCGGDWDYLKQCPSILCPTHPFRLPGNRTDTSSLIPAKQIENHPEYEGPFQYSVEKIVV